MLSVLTYQVIAAILGIVSTGAADWLYHRGSIRQRLHDFWVSASSTAVCLPLLIWTADVFLGSGVVSRVAIVAITAVTFFWIYDNLRKVPNEHELDWGQPVWHPTVRPATPNITGFDPVGDIDHFGSQLAPRAEVRGVEDIEVQAAPEARRKLPKSARASGAANARHGESAARSQNFL